MDRKKLKKEYARLVAESIKENIEPKDIEYINCLLYTSDAADD